MKLGVKAYLKSVGFQFDKTAVKLDRMFYTSLSDDEKQAFARYSAVLPQHKDIKDLLKIPKTVKQAARLFSQDANRYIASMECMDSFLNNLSPGKGLDIGCGAGFLIGFLSEKHPSFSFEGLESQQNLAQIARDFTRKNVFNLNYLTELPPQTYDYVLCEFGWDHSDIAGGGTPHDLKELYGHQYCDGCSTAARSSYAAMFQNWEQMLSENGKLLVTGRLGSIGNLIAFLSAANEYDLITSDKDAQWVHWKQGEIQERAPALMFKRDSPKSDEEILGIVRDIYKRARN